jgi:hypothetical protein
VDLRDLRARHERRQRVAAERDHERRVDQLELAVQPADRVRHLVGARVAVARRPRLQDVGDVDRVARQAGLAEELVEQPPGAADERPAGRVLARARRLADQHDLGRDGTLAGHRVLARLARLEAAAAMRADLGRQGVHLRGG